MSRILFELRGTPELNQRLRTLDERVRKSVVASAIGKAARPIVAAAKRTARKPMTAAGQRTGGLSKSIGKVVRRYAKTVLCVIGSISGKKYTRLGKQHEPSNIAHLVEFGHRIAVGGTLARKKPAGLTRHRVLAKAGYMTWSRLTPGYKGKWTDESVWMPRVGGGGVFAYLHGNPGVTAKSKRTGVAGGGTSRGVVAPQPFLRPAWDANKARAQSVLERELAAGIEKAAAK